MNGKKDKVYYALLKAGDSCNAMCFLRLYNA